MKPAKVIPVKQDFLILGHGRSGTNYMAALFQWFGYQVGARKYGYHGMAHNFPPAINPSLWPLKEARNRFHKIVHVVRHPQRVLCSAVNFDFDIADENSTRIPEIKNYATRIERSAMSIVLWNRAISILSPDLTVHVEEAPGICRQWLERNGYNTVPSDGNPPPTDINTNSVPYRTLEFDEGSTAKAALMEHCNEYGYSWMEND